MSSEDDLSRWFQNTEDLDGTDESAMPGIEIPLGDDDAPFSTVSADAKLKKKPKTSTTILSREEVLAMQETEHLFSNELWKLTFDEMLNVIIQPSVRRSIVNDFLGDLGDVLTPDDDDDTNATLKCPKKLSSELLCPHFHLSDQKSLQNFLKSHFQNIHCDQLNIIGSYLLKANLNKPHLSVDVAVEMDESILSKLLENDKLDRTHLQQYYKLRYLFLVVLFYNLREQLQSKVSASGASVKLHWKLFRGLDEMKPYIQIEIQQSDAKESDGKASKEEDGDNDEHIASESSVYYVNLYPMVPPNQSDALESLLSSLLQNQSPHPSTQISHLVHGIWEDIHPMDHLNIFHSTFHDCPTVIQTLCLIKVWSRLRGMLYTCDGINGYVWNAILAHLRQRSVIDGGMSPYQIFKIALRWVTALRTDVPIILGEQESVDDQNLPNVQRMYQSGESLVFLFDSADEFNAFHRISSLSWKELVYEAKHTLSYLNEEEQRIECVQSTFTAPHQHFRKYDVHIVVENLGAHLQHHVKEYKAPRLCTHQKLSELLYYGLGDRCDAIRIIGNAQNFQSSDKKNVVVGLILSDAWEENIVRGPARSGHDVIGLEKVLIDRFQSVWGSKSQLIDSTFDAHMIYGVELEKLSSGKNPVHRITEIANYLLSKHFGNKESSTPAPHARLTGDFLYDHHYISQKVQEDLRYAYDDALLLLHETLDTIDVNLKLQDVLGISPEYRNSALSPILLNAHIVADEEEIEDLNPDIVTRSSNVTPLRVILDFQQGSKWPLTPEACRQLKTYIYTVYHQGLKENNIFSRVCESHLDVYVSGFVMRTQIRLPEEVNRYKTSGHIMDPFVIALDRDVSMLPVHAAYIQNFVRHYPQYSHVCRLAKRWINAHLFGLDMPEPLIELLVAYSCYTSEPYRPSKSALLCFYNFIHLLATYPWDTAPLFVNLQLDPDNGIPYLTDEDREKMVQIRTEFEYTPKRPAMYVVASYAYDERHFWTKFNLPSTVVGKRMIALSKKALSLMDALLQDDIEEGTEANDWNLLFQTSFQVFNPTIDVRHLNNVQQGIMFEPENLLDSQHFVGGTELTPKEDLTVNMFPPLDLLRRMRRTLGRFGAFFMDPCNPTTIGVAWNPDVVGNKGHTVELNQLRFMQPSDAHEGKLQVNVQEIYGYIKDMSTYREKKATIRDKTATKQDGASAKRKREDEGQKSKKKQKRSK